MKNKPEVKSEIFLDMVSSLEPFLNWSSNIYIYCKNNTGFVPMKNQVAEENSERLLRDVDTYIMAMTIVLHYANHGNYITRRALAKALSEKWEARDNKIVRDLDKLEHYKLFIHHKPSEVAGDRGARFIEPSDRLICFFNDHWKGNK